ncbi:MAG: dihydrodipicolinate synthase family protein [Opitutaceae bacterium]
MPTSTAHRSASAAPAPDWRRRLRAGQVIPALPLALGRARRWDERSQRALVRYYVEAGAGGLAVGVHSTQFAIRDPGIGLYGPVLELAAREARPSEGRRPAAAGAARGPSPAAPGSPAPILIAGVIGRTRAAVSEARLARELGYDAALLGLGAWSGESDAAMLRHCRCVADELPILGFYLQEAAGGRPLGYRFWRQFAEIPNAVGVKIAPFNRYRTFDVVRAVLEAGRDELALYTGNDDNIIGDLLTRFTAGGRSRWMDGGLLGQWGIWTRAAVRLFGEIRRARSRPGLGPLWMERNAALTDANAAVFDPAHGFAGCLAGIQEVLRRQGLVRSAACLDPAERLSSGQAAELTRVTRAYPWLVDDDFVAANLDRWRS